MLTQKPLAALAGVFGPSIRSVTAPLVRGIENRKLQNTAEDFLQPVVGPQKFQVRGLEHAPPISRAEIGANQQAWQGNLDASESPLLEGTSGEATVPWVYSTQGLRHRLSKQFSPEDLEKMNPGESVKEFAQNYYKPPGYTTNVVPGMIALGASADVKLRTAQFGYRPITPPIRKELDEMGVAKSLTDVDPVAPGAMLAHESEHLTQDDARASEFRNKAWKSDNEDEYNQWSRRALAEMETPAVLREVANQLHTLGTARPERLEELHIPAGTIPAVGRQGGGLTGKQFLDWYQQNVYGSSGNKNMTGALGSPAGRQLLNGPMGQPTLYDKRTYWMEQLKRLNPRYKGPTPLPAVLGLPANMKQAAATVVDRLLQAKEHSDAKRYSRKHAILRQLLGAAPDEFFIDSGKGGTHPGLTHTPSGFRIHAPKGIARLAAGKQATALLQAFGPAAVATPWLKQADVFSGAVKAVKAVPTLLRNTPKTLGTPGGSWGVYKEQAGLGASAPPPRTSQVPPPAPQATVPAPWSPAPVTAPQSPQPPVPPQDWIQPMLGDGMTKANPLTLNLPDASERPETADSWLAQGHQALDAGDAVVSTGGAAATGYGAAGARWAPALKGLPVANTLARGAGRVAAPLNIARAAVDAGRIATDPVHRGKLVDNAAAGNVSGWQAAGMATDPGSWPTLATSAAGVGKGVFDSNRDAGEAGQRLQQQGSDQQARDTAKRNQPWSYGASSATDLPERDFSATPQQGAATQAGKTFGLDRASRLPQSS